VLEHTSPGRASIRRKIRPIDSWWLCGSCALRTSLFAGALAAGALCAPRFCWRALMRRESVLV
jgi:hypothetical protein